MPAYSFSPYSMGYYQPSFSPHTGYNQPSSYPRSTQFQAARRKPGRVRMAIGDVIFGTVENVILPTAHLCTFGLFL